jgi:hypothetical protein
MFKNNILHEYLQVLEEELIPKFYSLPEGRAKRLFRNEKATAEGRTGPI